MILSLVLFCACVNWSRLLEAEGGGDTLERSRVLEPPVVNIVGVGSGKGGVQKAVGAVVGVGSRGCAKLHRGFVFYGSGVAYEAQ